MRAKEVTFHLVVFEDQESYVKGSSEFPLLFKKAFEWMEEMEPEFKEKGELFSLYNFNYRYYFPENEEGFEEIKAQPGLNIFLCGSHVISYFAYKQFYNGNQDFVVVDYHPDLRKFYGKRRLSHATVSYLISSLGSRVYQWGIGEMSIEDLNNAQSNNIFWKKPRIKELKSQVYLSLDVDGFSLFSKVSTPSIPNISWQELSQFLAELFRKKEVIAFDLVELLPKEDEVMRAALLVRKLLFYALDSPST